MTRVQEREVGKWVPATYDARRGVYAVLTTNLHNSSSLVTEVNRRTASIENMATPSSSSEERWAYVAKSLRRFASGAVAGTLTAVLLQPLDVIRTTQQGRRVDHSERGARLCVGHAAEGSMKVFGRLACVWHRFTHTVLPAPSASTSGACCELQVRLCKNREHRRYGRDW